MFTFAIVKKEKPDIAVCGTHIVFQNNSIGHCGNGFWSDSLRSLVQGNIFDA
ncbi:MAG: hypothetical protein LBE13_06245 [Bacteroidales bacterium]|jgi:hypothetical protein|nr:hypothetical protein [Bacteroidales bacterium]